MIKHILTNWKTTLAGAATIILTLLTAKGKLDAQTAAAITSGVGLIIAKDAHQDENKTNGEPN
jgi:hypothetical protein